MLVLRRIIVETQHQMRMPKLFGASLKMEPLSIIGNTVIHSMEDQRPRKLQTPKEVTQFHQTQNSH
jgi:hypothetical protein